jgi:hypothetical protein
VAHVLHALGQEPYGRVELLITRKENGFSVPKEIKIGITPVPKAPNVNS